MYLMTEIDMAADDIVERLRQDFTTDPIPLHAEAAAEIERLRAAVATGLSWLNDLEHMGSIVDQEALSGDISKLTAALGWVRTDEQSAAGEKP